MNLTVLIGRLVKDVEERVTANGTHIAPFTIAVNRVGQDEADFINCICFGKVAENVARYCGKGSQVGVKGRIQTRNYENQQGQKVYVTEIVCDQVEFLSRAEKKQEPQHEESFSYGNIQNEEQKPFMYDYGEDLPF